MAPGANHPADQYGGESIAQRHATPISDIEIAACNVRHGCVERGCSNRDSTSAVCKAHSARDCTTPDKLAAPRFRFSTAYSTV